MNYPYVNMDLTIKRALRLLSERGFTLRKIEKIYHVRVMRLIPWAPAYIFILEKSC
ncbi:MAG: hypothetical protein QXL27_08520 [Candidatus Bathyarchaeia archaeon]